MTKIFFSIFILLFLIFPITSAEDEDLIALIKKYPSLVATYASALSKENDSIKVNWFRTNLLETFPVNLLTCKDNQLFLENKVVPFLDLELSKKETVDANNRIFKNPVSIFKWEIEIEKEGKFLIVKDGDLGLEGYLNDSPILIINNGILSKKGTGKLWLELIKGKNILYILATPKKDKQLLIFSESRYEQIQKELIKKLKSNAKEDLLWTFQQFLPQLAKLKKNCHQYITPLLEKIHKNNLIQENLESANLLSKIIQSCTVEFDGYMIEKYIYLKLPNIYFYFSKENENLNSFILKNNIARSKFLEQLIYDGQNELVDLYFNKCIEVISKNEDFKDKDKFIAKFYVDRYLYYFRIGRVKDCIELFKITEEKYKTNATELKYIDYLFSNCRAGLLVKEEDQLFISTFDESKATIIKETIENYDGSQESLSKAYGMYINLPNSLVKKNSLIVSLPYYFLLCKDENPKFNEDFKKICQEKIQVKIEKAKETRDITLMQELIDKFEVITPLPEIRVILLEEYFLRGSFLKALSQAYVIFANYPSLHLHLIAKLTYLEELSEVYGNSRKEFLDKLKQSEYKIKGVNTSILKQELLTPIKRKEPSKLGKFIKSIPLDPPHLQYTDHPQLNEYQPIETLFTEKSIIFNGGSYLINYDTKSNNVSWDYYSAYEYGKGIEPGPHQKRFITAHAGDQIFMFTNKDYSGQKTIKSFDLKGNLLWDVSERSDGLSEEPVCTPIESQGKLFCLTYSNNETINTFNYSVIDSHTGKILIRTHLSLIPNKILDYNSYPFPRNWNSFTHDQHFVKEDSSIFGFSGTGVLFKADANSGNLLWAKGVARSSFYHNNDLFSEYGFAPSGYIKVFGNTLVSLMPDVQIFTAVDKTSSDHIWKSKYYRPKFIHGRENKDAIFFSDFPIKDETSVFKLNPLTGEIIWQISTNGVKIVGEGDIVGNKLYLPSDKSLLVIDLTNGEILESILLKVEPLKFRNCIGLSVILTKKSALIFQNDGVLDSNQIVNIESQINVSSIIEPDISPSKEISFENINLELAIKIPETFFSGIGHWKRTKIVKTSKPFHFLMMANEHISLFREGYTQKNGVNIPPAIIWYGQYPSYAIADETIYISSHGKIEASNIFTREKKWTYEYASKGIAFPNRREKIVPYIAACKGYIAFQTENDSIQVIDTLTQKSIIEFYSPTIRAICMENNHVITLAPPGLVRCYDINQKGKEIWSISHNNRSDIYAENGNFVFVKYSDSSIGFYDIATGKLKIQAKPVLGSTYTMNQWQLDKNYLYAYNMLYDAKSGLPISTYKEGYLVHGGGFIGVFKQYGNEGNYIFNGKEFLFKSKCNRDHNNFNFSAYRKGNKLMILSDWWIEIFEILDDKLVLIEEIKFNSGYYGDGQFPGDMQLSALDDCIFIARKDEMYFLKNFDINLNFESISSFRVENRKNVEWPHSELYPEVEVKDNQWLNYYDSKPQRKLSYQIFADEKIVYLKFKLDPLVKNNLNYILYISGNGRLNNVAIRWDPDQWDKCQVSPNLNNIISSWRETDLDGNIFLYIKISLEKVFAREFKNTLPNFNIELRQMSNEQLQGLYRIGGAYHNTRNFFPWLNYINDESDLLSDYQLRTSSYENQINFYPQGIDFVNWIKDRRKIYGVENNIKTLNKMLEANAKIYCSINILSTLFLEEIQFFKIQQPNYDELSDEFTQEVNKIIKRLSQQAIQLGISKEWVDFALSVVTVEIFPFKLDYNGNYSGKSIFGTGVVGSKKLLIADHFVEKANPLTSVINQPYLEWILPGLMTGFPRGVNIEAIILFGVGIEKTGVGRMNLYSPAGSQEFCNRLGKFINPEFKLNATDSYFKLEPSVLVERKYYSKGKQYDCFTIAKSIHRNILVPIPEIKAPAILKSTGQTGDTILSGLAKLTSDNGNGPLMLQDYLALSGKLDEDETKALYGKFLNSLKGNTRACYHSLRNIYQKNSRMKDPFAYMLELIKLAKLSTASPRLFFLEYKNIFADKNSFSFLGPIEKELINKPEKKLDPLAEYKTENSSHQFVGALAAKKGGTIYLASNVSLTERDRVYLIASGMLYSKCFFSIWVNGKPVIENQEYVNFGTCFAQSMSLNAGENQLLIKIIGDDDYEWSKNFALIIGDNFGAPSKGLEMKPIK